MLEKLLMLYKSIQKIILTSILTGALFFLDCPVHGQNNIAKSDTISRTDSLLLVTSDTLITIKTTSGPKFTDTDSNVKIVTKEDSMRIKKDHSPRIAGMYSAIIPGLGQAYNRKYWKIPLLYIGGGALVYYCVDENKSFKEFQGKYNLELNKPSGLQSKDSLDYYGRVRDGYRTNRDRLIFFTALVYAANIIDAMVDAYFYNFDISDNLTMKLEPEFDYQTFAMGDISYGLKLSFKF
jgi:hypothetical protein